MQLAEPPARSDRIPSAGVDRRAEARRTRAALVAPPTTEPVAHEQVAFTRDDVDRVLADL